MTDWKHNAEIYRKRMAMASDVMMPDQLWALYFTYERRHDGHVERSGEVFESQPDLINYVLDYLSEDDVIAVVSSCKAGKSFERVHVTFNQADVAEWLGAARQEMKADRQDRNALAVPR